MTIPHRAAYNIRGDGLMNKFVQNAILAATNHKIKGTRAFFPEWTNDRGDYIQPVKVGFVSMTGGDTPGGLYLTVLKDTEDKVMAYFLLGGTIEGMTDELISTLKDNDKVVIIGTDLNGELQAAFAVDMYDKQIDQVMHFYSYCSSWGIEEVIRKTFQNSKVYDTFT
ncbi:putative Transcription-repair coupling factor [Brevibacillus phage SecTim467]|uniref:Uncharacterized protein n=2 Tax=Jenstvirus jenst TaxID=1982225 RepID=A0A0K2CNV6_9CAUD|nr:hypothetical protein AVV11_gp025 [Brevibacillus phage Jenst]ALA07295.1 hypothetical protein JENST_166 [Brevibacillus phage Jenst]ALA07584.1 putative Transcription-repair coupling factor [Brevibacillus phage SecTim467]